MTPEELVDVFEFRNDGPPSEADIDDIWIAGHPIGRLIRNNKDRTRNLEKDSVDVADILDAPSNQLPIQAWTHQRKAGAEFNYPNKYRATFIWEVFLEHATEEHGRIKLSSERVKRILTLPNGLGIQDPNPNTVKRVMEWVAKGTGVGEGGDPHDEETNLVCLRTDTRNMLVADHDEFYATIQSQLRDADDADEESVEASPDTDTVAAEMHDLASATPVRTDADDSVKSSVSFDGGEPQ